MVKKRVRDAEVVSEIPIQASTHDEDSDGSDQDADMVNVDFEWFNMKPEIDFHGIKNLLRQLFDIDSQLFDLSALTDLILSQPTIGSTVKVDGEDTDPYAFLTILNMYEHREKPVMKELMEYLVEKSKSIPSMSQLAGLIIGSSTPVGLILTERLINIPAEIGPHMYAMLLDEIESAVDDGEPYEFTHYLIMSKTYMEVESLLDQEDAPRQKKSKAGKSPKEILYFHPEDEVFHRHAQAYGGFEYTNAEGDAKADSKRAFQELGIKPQGHAVLIEAKNFEDAVKASRNYLGSQQP